MMSDMTSLTSVDARFLTWETVLQRWQAEQRAAGKSTGTIALRLYHLQRLQRVLPTPVLCTDQYPAGDYDATADVLITWLGTFTHRRPEYLRSLRTSLSVIYGWAFRRRLIAWDPTTDLDPVRIPMPDPRPATDADITAALETAEPRVWAMIMLGAICGLRRAEISRVHARDFDVADGRLHVEGKGKKRRTIDLPVWLAQKLHRQAVEQPGGWLFPNVAAAHQSRWANKPLSAKHVGKLISRTLPEGVTPHQLRHAAATQLHELGVPFEEIRIFLGHSSILTTQRYVAVRPKHTAAATAVAAERFGARQPYLRPISA